MVRAYKLMHWKCHDLVIIFYNEVDLEKWLFVWNDDLWLKKDYIIKYHKGNILGHL